MRSDQLIRLAGLAAIGAGIFSGIGDVMSLVVDLEAESTASGPQTLVFGLYLIGGLLLPLGLVGLYLRQASRGGTLGFVGFLLAFVGSVLITGAIWYEIFVLPDFAARAPEVSTAELGFLGFVVSFLVASLGWVVFAVATLRADVFPRSAAVLLLAGALVSLVPLFVQVPASGIVLSVAVAWLGFLLWRQPTPDSATSHATPASRA